MRINPKYSGTTLVLSSALLWSTAGLFTNVVLASVYLVIFWRGVSAALLIVGYLTASGRWRSEVRTLNKPAVAVIVFSGTGTLCFLPAFRLTSVAHVALIYASAPLICALLGWLAFRHKPDTRTLLLSLLAMIGVAIIFGDTAVTSTAAASPNRMSLTGDLLALAMTVMMAAVMVVYRHWPQTPSALPNALASLWLLPVMLLLDNPLEISFQDLLITLSFGAIFALASILLFEGARRLPPARTALLSVMEVPLAPVWAVLVLDEIPTSATVIGGTLVFASIVGEALHVTERNHAGQRVSPDSAGPAR